MTPRQRRLLADRAEVDDLSSAGSLTFTTRDGEFPDQYDVRIEVAGLERDGTGRVHLRTEHEFSAFLPIDYPRRPPVISWRTPIFHPNILGPERHGAVCLGYWAPGESLADLCRRLIAMVAYEAFNLEDALDRDAAGWARARGLKPGDRLLDVVANPV
jgi:ubiquitin-protein ligase